jgi:hypothetical protein
MIAFRDDDDFICSGKRVLDEPPLATDIVFDDIAFFCSSKT